MEWKQNQKNHTDIKENSIKSIGNEGKEEIIILSSIIFFYFMNFRSRSRSPSDFIKGRLPDEVKKHLEFKLIDTEGMTETQLRDIPYKVVETNSKGKTHRKQSSPSGKRKHYIKNYDR